MIFLLLSNLVKISINFVAIQSNLFTQLILILNSRGLLINLNRWKLYLLVIITIDYRIDSYCTFRTLRIFLNLVIPFIFSYINWSSIANISTFFIYFNYLFYFFLDILLLLRSFFIKCIQRSYYQKFYIRIWHRFFSRI